MTDLERWIQDAGGGQGLETEGASGTEKQSHLGNNKTAVLSSVVYPTGLPIEYRLPIPSLTQNTP